MRHFYCSATRDVDATPELVRIGYQPRREPGEGGDGGSSSSSSGSSSSSSSSGAVPQAPQNFTLQSGPAGSGAVIANSEPPLAAEGVTEIRLFSGGTLVATVTELPAEIPGFNSGDPVALTARYVNAAGESGPSDTGTATAG